MINGVLSEVSNNVHKLLAFKT